MEKNAYADVGLNEKPCIFEKMSFQVRGSDNVRLFRKRKWRNWNENEAVTKKWTWNWRVDTLNRARRARLYNEAVENLVNAYGIRHKKEKKRYQYNEMEMMK